MNKAKILKNNITRNYFLNKYKNIILEYQYMLNDRNQPAVEMKIKKLHNCAWQVRGDGGHGIMKCDII